MPDLTGSAQSDLRVLLVMAQSSGGIGRHVRSVAGGLSARGVATSVCAPEATLANLGLGAVDARVVAAPLGGWGPGDLRTSRRVLHCEGARVDVVHAHGLRAGADCAAFAAAARLVVTWHNAPVGSRHARLGHSALSRYVARSADLTLAASEDLAEQARAAGARQVTTTFVTAPPLGPPARSAEQVRLDLGVGDRPLVLAVGRLQWQKRFDVLVDAAASWPGGDVSPRVVIAGEGPARQDLATQIAATRAPVSLLGARQDVADLLAAADVVALPSMWEAKALVAQEALRAGVPLVTTAVGGLPSLVGDAAVLVPVGDPAALRDALEGVLYDAHRRADLSAAGRARAAGWPTEQASLDALIGSYRDLLQRASGRKGSA